MKRLKTVLTAAMLAFSSLAMSDAFDRDPSKIMQENQRAMEAYAAAQGKPSPEVVSYQYGMELDVAKVISVTRKANVCGVVPSRMTYLDSKGSLRTVEYRAVGLGCHRG
jgi:hypothetical protein